MENYSSILTWEFPWTERSLVESMQWQSQT